MHIKKFDKDEQILFAEVYSPGLPDADRDFMTRSEIEKAAHNFMKNLRLKNIDVNHDYEQTGSYVIESFIARQGDPLFIEGSWVVGIKVEDPELWEDVVTNKINGLSWAGKVKRSAEPIEVEMEVPDLITGTTQESAGHSHSFALKLRPDGKIDLGETDVIDGHSHSILKGSVTETANGHAHRFSYLEVIFGEN